MNNEEGSVIPDPLSTALPVKVWRSIFSAAILAYEGREDEAEATRFAGGYANPERWPRHLSSANAV